MGWCRGLGFLVFGCGVVGEGAPQGETGGTGTTSTVSSTAEASTTSGSAETDEAEAGSTQSPDPGSSGGGSTTGGSDPATTSSGDSSSSGGPSEGMLRVLTYNVAGLPDLISGGDPAINTPLISPLLNDYELALVQEDFSYHADLAADAMHPHQSEPGGTGTLGDGLNRFSSTAFSDHERATWVDCNGLFDSGSDCLTGKGFSVATHTFGPGAEVDIYNFHMDAGGSNGDIAARQAQIAQIVETIEMRSVGRALIVAGDTNMDEEDEADFLTLLAGGELLDACRELACGEEFRIDRIMYRNSDAVELVPSNWIVDTAFVDGAGDPLSDHEAIAVDFAWQAL